jgi:outer membrane protein assembly factor BamB
MPEQEQSPSQTAQSMFEASQSIGQSGRKAMKKKRVTRLSTPLPVILSPDEDEEETIKRAAIPRSKPPDVRQPQVEPAIMLPVQDEDDIEEASKEALANHQTHIMLVSPRLNEVAAREVLAERATSVLPASPYPVDIDQPANEQQPQHNQKQRVLPFPALPAALSRWKLSHVLLVLVVLAPFIIGGGILEAAQLNQSQSDLYQVNALNGDTQWQQTPSSILQAAHTDAQGSILNVDIGKGFHQLVALNPDGTTLWKTPPSQQTYSLLLPTSQPDTIPIALSGDITVSTSLSDTVTYLNPLVLALLNRQNGHILWQMTLVNAQQAQGAAILGTDSSYIYVALAQTNLPDQQIKPAVQLLAVNQHTGQVAWRVNVPSQNATLQDTGYLIIQKNITVWQVAGTLNAIDTTQSKLLWRAFIEEPNLRMLPPEESQMAILDGNILLERTNAFHALDLMSGDAQWEIANPGLNTGNGFAVSSIATFGNTVFLYDGEVVEAVDASTQHIIWSQKQLDSIRNLNISVDGSLVYLTTTDSIEGSTPAQALVALDSKNGGVRWTFQPSDQVSFVSLLPNGILYNRNVLITLFCPVLPPAPCKQQYLYALNPATGAVLWKYTGNSISDVTLGEDGKTVLFQRNSSAWLDLTERFKNS